MELKSYDDKVVVGTVKIEKALTAEDVNHIISGAFEGGSNYWASVKKDTPVFEKRDKNTYLVDFVTDVLLEGGAIYINEHDDDGSILGTHMLTLEKLVKGVQKNTVNRPHDDYFNDNADAITYDCILQYALFGEIVYG